MKVFVVDVDGVAECAHAAAAALRAGRVVILPTDTIYGLSVRGDDVAAVRRLDRLKGRARPSTIIPHDPAWLAPLVEPRRRRSLARLLERYRGDTMLFRYAPDDARGASKALPRSLTQSGLIGVRQPRHWIAELAASLEFPIVTTSANRTGLPPMTSLDDLDPRIAAGVAVLVYEGPKAGRPSDLVFLDGPRARRVRR